jgi:hypothetical protein
MQSSGGFPPTFVWLQADHRTPRSDRTHVKGSEPLCDALLFEPIPYRSALRENCTHVLVLRTRPDGVSVTGKISLLEKLTYKRFFRYEKLRELYVSRTVGRGRS